jgi:hypothetical protein
MARVGLASIVVAVALAAAGPAQAAFEAQGTTFYPNGQPSATVSRGAPVTAFATGATPGGSYLLVASLYAPSSPSGPAGLAPLSQGLVTADAAGRIPATTGTVNRDPGSYYLFFFNVHTSTVTRPVLLLVPQLGIGGPDACSSEQFSVTLRGRGIARMKVLFDGHEAGVDRHAGRHHRFRVHVSEGPLAPGLHVVRARVKFKNGKKRTLETSFTCP